MQTPPDPTPDPALAGPTHRTCPTRPDGSEGLIAQTIQAPVCQDRQRQLYHKCWNCAHRNGAELLPPAPVLQLRVKHPSTKAEAI